MAGMPGVNSTAAVNVHSLALQVPIVELVAGGRVPTSTTASNAVIGVWTTASRQKVRVNEGSRHRGEPFASGPYVQVSRLGNPLVNELLIGIGDKDYWNSESPTADGSRFFASFANPLLGQLLPALYTANGTASGATLFPHLKAYNAAHTGTSHANAARPDLVAILLSGIPGSVTSALDAPPTNVGGKALADMLRLNVAQPPTRRHACPTSAISGVTRVASRTAGGSSTTSRRSSCGPWPVRPCRWSTRRSCPTPRPARSASA